jgi:hypothetical protein
MNKFRHAAPLFQVGFIVLLLACRVIASIGDAAVSSYPHSGQQIETAHIANPS